MTTQGTVIGLWRYPVKSMQGEAAEQLTFDERGAGGDRTWAVADRGTGKVLTGKLYKHLLEASASFDGESVAITLPDGSAHEAGAAATDAALSEWLGLDVCLTMAGAAAGTPYELTLDPADDDSGTWDFATPPGALVDLAAAHILTTASLAAMEAAAPDSAWDVRRFRPNVLLDVGSASSDFPEDAWVGQAVTIGGATFDPFMPCPRCALPTRAQPGGLPADKGIARALRDRNSNNLGIYCTVTTGGTVRMGDTAVT